MRVVLLGDSHFISPADPRKDIHAKRAHFTHAWPSFRDLASRIRASSPDLVVSVGDLVDYYSDENADFALELMGELKAPWVLTPGNHDLSVYREGETRPRPAREEAGKGWNARGIELGNRLVAAGSSRLLLVDSGFSAVLPGTAAWLRATLAARAPTIVLTHTPLDVPPVRELVVSVDPAKDLGKYVMSGSPDLFGCLRGRVDRVYAGHLHFAGRLDVEGTAMGFLPLSVTVEGASYPDMGQALVLDPDGSEEDRKSVV